MLLRTAPALLVALALLPRLATAATTPPFYVLTNNHLNTLVSDNRAGLLGAGDTYISGNLPQTTDSYSKNVAANGSFSGLVQEASGSISSTANIGNLHARVYAEATTSNYYYGDLASATARSTSSSFTEWFDTVSFHSSNPNGSLFTVEIALSAAIDNTAVASDAAGFSAGSTIRNMLVIHGLPVVTDPALVIDDNEFVNNNGAVATLPDSFERSYTFLVVNGITLTFLDSLDITASAGGGETESLADVGNTAHFAIHTSDPAASYTTASGVIFDTAVPEPTTAALLLPALSLLLLKTRRP